MKISMIGHKKIPSRSGGVEVVVYELSTRLAKLGHNVTCYNRGDTLLYKKYNLGNIKIKEVPTISLKGMAAVTSSFMAAVMSVFDESEVVHFHAEGPSFFCWIPKIVGKRVVVTIHGLDHLRDKWGRCARLYIKAGEWCATRFADSIIVLSNDVKKYFRNNYNCETVFIKNGAETHEYKEPFMIKDRYGLSRNSYILYLGRLVPEKGAEYLIKAFSKIKTDKKLVIAGGSSDTDAYVRKLHDLAVNDNRVIFTGFVQGEILEELYSNAYIYVLPSNLEGMPLSLLEAMSYGKCCVTSDIAECAEVLGESGETFPKGNVFELENILVELCKKSDLVNELGKKAALQVRDNYNWDDVVAATLAVYREK